ncbi:MAG: hypothetical protein COU81_03520 [Candidatus Portnoybacteria bacterium CG10_big_fil_rev_8_21_14_0_10_36_7]|uniref:Uncharacterized protein n=1 Tax=Candidatus Portnoybacteria bacterium CG10_big_fil_rev_8_21_14_0_10_36_7 TaxID=1974812 RepID=A0A2M8KDB7_9BACT|nr:MAG: hypothetical protein COU81_03520 [Candidatus Portnoybacteria bacterium CG10_big_fil_rev_8_21_14_0_10_36_7]
MNKYLIGLRGLVSRKPKYIILYVTARCNARCKMCFYWKEINNASNQTELTLDEIDKISHSFGMLQYVTLTGGEPSLRNDLPNITRIFDENNQVQFVSIPTNSIQVDNIQATVEEILKSTKHPRLKLCLSMDGLGSDHDNIRGVIGCFDKVLQNYSNLVKLKKNVKDFDIMINMTVSSYNVDKVEEVMNFVRQNMPEANFDFGWARGDVRDKASRNVVAADYERVSRIVNSREENYSSGFEFSKIMATNKLVMRDLIVHNLKGEKRFYSCSAGRDMVIISENGEVRPCEMLDVAFGNLRDANCDINKILSTELAKKTLKYIKDKKCTCTFENALQCSLAYNPSSWPLIIRKMISRR